MTFKLSYEGKNTKKAEKNPTICDLEWAAGFLQGECWIGKPKGTESIQVANQDGEPLAKLLEIFGGIIWRKSDSILEWRVHGSRARGIMLTLYSLFSNRLKERIKKIFLN